MGRLDGISKYLIEIPNRVIVTIKKQVATLDDTDRLCEYIETVFDATRLAWFDPRIDQNKVLVSLAVVFRGTTSRVFTRALMALIKLFTSYMPHMYSGLDFGYGTTFVQCKHGGAFVIIYIKNDNLNNSNVI